MSVQLLGEDILFRQRLLASCGVYAAALDGIHGPKTEAAELAFAARSQEIAALEGRFDPNSEAYIGTLHLRAQPLARRSLAALKAHGLNVRIVSGTRTYAEQTTLYAKGRFGSTEAQVTNAKAGQSWHNFGMAWDIGLFDSGGGYIEADPPYKAAGPIGRIAGVDWGGDWITFQDYPHFQVAAAGRDVSLACADFEQGHLA